MTPEEARTILGLKAEDDPQTYLADFVDARERIAEMVRRAPNDTIAMRYQEGLQEFDRALAAIREEIERKKAAAQAADEIRSASPVTTGATPPPLPKDYFKPPVQDIPKDLPPEIPKILAAQPPKVPEETPKISGEQNSKVVAVEVPNISLAETPKVLSEDASKVAAVEAPKIFPAETPKVLSEDASKVAAVEAPKIPSAETPKVLSGDASKVAAVEMPKILPAETPKVLSEDASKIAAVEASKISPAETPKVLSEDASKVVAVEAPKILPAETPKVLSEDALKVAAVEAPKISPAETPKVLSEDAAKIAIVEAPKIQPAETPKILAEDAAKIAAIEAPKILPAETPEILSVAAWKAVSVEPPKIPSLETPAVLSPQPPKIPAAEAPKILSEEPPDLPLAGVPKVLSVEAPKETSPVAAESLPETSSPESSPPPLRFVMPRRLLEGVKLEAQPLSITAAAESTSPTLPSSANEDQKTETLFSAVALKPDEKAEPSSVISPDLKPFSSPVSTPPLAAKEMEEKKPDAPVSAFIAATPKPEPKVEAIAETKPEPADEISFISPLVAEGKAAPPAASSFVAPEPPVKARPPLHSFKDEERSPGRRVVPALVAIILLGGLGGLGWWYYQDSRLRRAERLTDLENLGAKMVEARQWQEATKAYDEIKDLDGSEEIVMRGRRSIEAGMDDEQKQFIGYWSGEALAAFEAGRWEDAEDAAHKLLERYPDQTETAALLTKIEQAKATKAIEDLKKAIREGIQHHQWDAAEANANELAKRFPEDAEATSLLKEIRTDRDREIRNHARAEELYAAAKLKDQGRFDKEAMEWLRDAISLSPDNKDIAALYEKFASYTRTIRVPGDFPDLQKALQSCGDRDRIVLGEGTWPGPLVINKAVSLEGAGPDKTIIEVAAKDGAAASFGPGAKGARITGLSFRHSSFDNSADRFPALLVRGGEVTAADCRFADASGHGAAIINGGLLNATRCTFENNGWDGVATRGKGSRLVVVECESNSNFGHGYDVWDGASAAIRTSHAFQNSRNGILIDTGSIEVTLEENELRGNREFGLVVSAASSGKVSSNICRENLLGGLVMRAGAAPLTLENNRAEKNIGPGLVYEKGLPAAKYTTNAAAANGAGKDTMANVDFSSPH